MLSVSSLVSALTSLKTSMFSPSVNPCMTRVRDAPKRYFNNPYNACVVPACVLPVSPSVTASIARRQECMRNSQRTTPVAAAIAAPSLSIAELPSAAETTEALVQAYAAQTPKSQSATQPPSPSVRSASDDCKAAAAVTHFAVVRFKYESFTYIAPFRVSVGDVVVVEGDRGEHAGKVESITTTAPSFEVSNRIVRKATTKDHQLMDAHREKELTAVSTCRRLAESTGLGNIKVLDAEFQFDMNKLTIYFRAKTTYIDFRKLQRGLFKEFRCRIWLSHMDEVEAIERQHCR